MALRQKPKPFEEQYKQELDILLNRMGEERQTPHANSQSPRIYLEKRSGADRRKGVAVGSYQGADRRRSTRREADRLIAETTHLRQKTLLVFSAMLVAAILLLLVMHA